MRVLMLFPGRHEPQRDAGRDDAQVEGESWFVAVKARPSDARHEHRDEDRKGRGHDDGDTGAVRAVVGQICDEQEHASHD